MMMVIGDETSGVDEENARMMMMMMMKNMMMMMTMMMMMMMPGNVDDGSSVNCSATYRSKRPSDAVRPRPRSTLNFCLNWSQLVNYRDPVMLFVRDRDPP